MKALVPMDSYTVPLRGSNLVEAAAGTGKTWTIAALYLRLVLEKDIAVGNILVVTYTHAATRELRQRIRSRLVEALQACRQGNAGVDPLFAAHSDMDLVERRLQRAVVDFDEAAIFTIHGFCRRVLAESAFESALPFESELLTDEREILVEVVDDFWRR
ncbi:MAG: UvrD-helicase domain-containing protein, partial [Pseudomonadota bacterium]|nr:UvrD-helicase domain-containing protein [Pseudomonadota bacterium]